MSRGPETDRLELIYGFFGVIQGEHGVRKLTGLGKVQLVCILVSIFLSVLALANKPPQRASLTTVSGKPILLKEWKERRRGFRSDALHYCILFAIPSFEPAYGCSVMQSIRNQSSIRYVDTSSGNVSSK